MSAPPQSMSLPKSTPLNQLPHEKGVGEVHLGDEDDAAIQAVLAEMHAQERQVLQPQQQHQQQHQQQGPPQYQALPPPPPMQQPPLMPQQLQVNPGNLSLSPTPSFGYYSPAYPLAQPPALQPPSVVVEGFSQDNKPASLMDLFSDPLQFVEKKDGLLVIAICIMIILLQHPKVDEIIHKYVGHVSIPFFPLFVKGLLGGVVVALVNKVYL